MNEAIEPGAIMLNGEELAALAIALWRIERRDYEGCRLNGRQALVYLPDEKARKNRFYDEELRQ